MSSTTGTMTDSGEQIGDDGDEDEEEDEFNDDDDDDDNEWSSCFEIPVETILACLSV